MHCVCFVCFVSLMELEPGIKIYIMSHEVDNFWCVVIKKSNNYLIKEQSRMYCSIFPVTQTLHLTVSLIKCLYKHSASAVSSGVI